MPNSLAEFKKCHALNPRLNTKTTSPPLPAKPSAIYRPASRSEPTAACCEHWNNAESVLRDIRQIKYIKKIIELFSITLYLYPCVRLVHDFKLIYEVIMHSTIKRTRTLTARITVETENLLKATAEAQGISKSTLVANIIGEYAETKKALISHLCKTLSEEQKVQLLKESKNEIYNS